jgi:hypothetical protein
VIKYSIAALGHFISGDHIEKSMREKETAKAFLLAHAPLLFATRAANVCWYSGKYP